VVYLEWLKTAIETLRIAGVPATAETDNFPNTSHEHYRYIDPLGGLPFEKKNIRTLPHIRDITVSDTDPETDYCNGGLSLFSSVPLRNEKLHNLYSS
jgi:hypothetical protein